MFNHRLDQTPSNIVIFHWFLLAFNGGCINAGGFLATGRFVSHVTGFATLFGVNLSSHEFEAATGILSVPVFFLLGAFLAGILVGRPVYQKKSPHYDAVMGLSALCLFMAAAYGGLSHFDSEGMLVHLKKVYVLLSLLCLACGLQNGAITSSSGSSVRTTHMTGITTDFGLGLARLLTIQKSDSDFPQEVLANRLRGGSIFAFVLGSAVGAFFFVRMGYVGFVFPGLIATYAAWHGRRAKVIAHQESFQL